MNTLNGSLNFTYEAVDTANNNSNLTSPFIVHDNDISLSNISSANASQFCEEWPLATRPSFQVANAFHLVSFLIPHTFAASAFIMRSVVSLGQLLFLLWAARNTCSLDIMLWNFFLVLINGGVSFYLGLRLCPPIISRNYKDLYEKVFKPLKVSKRQFKNLINDAEVRWLEMGEHYALEDVTKSAVRLSILLQGKMEVSCDGTHLHFIFPNQFIDSVEWEAQEFIEDVEAKKNATFQVKISASERSQLVTWSRKHLTHVLDNNLFLASVLHCLIGKDITSKLYSLSDQQKKISTNPNKFGIGWQPYKESQNLSQKSPASTRWADAFAKSTGDNK